MGNLVQIINCRTINPAFFLAEKKLDIILSYERVDKVLI